MVRQVYAICEYCGRCLTELKYDNPAKRNSTENLVTCDDCFKKIRRKVRPDETYTLGNGPAGQWPPRLTFWIHKRPGVQRDEMHDDNTEY